MAIPTMAMLCLPWLYLPWLYLPWLCYAYHLLYTHGGGRHRPERCAITTRVATSFLRVGHFELYARRARRGEATGLQAPRRPTYTC